MRVYSQKISQDLKATFLEVCVRCGANLRRGISAAFARCGWNFWDLTSCCNF